MEVTQCSTNADEEFWPWHGFAQILNKDKDGPIKTTYEWNEVRFIH